MKEKDVPDNSSVNIDLIRGHMDTIILRTLSDGDKYGYEILSEISDKSDGLYSLKQPTLYSCLKRLEKQGLVTSYKGDLSYGAQRVYYSLTDMGRQFLENDQIQWEFSRTIINNLLSDKDYDPEKSPKPFDVSSFRPLTRRQRGDANYYATIDPSKIAEAEKDEFAPEYGQAVYSEDESSEPLRDDLPPAPVERKQVETDKNENFSANITEESDILPVEDVVYDEPEASLSDGSDAEPLYHDAYDDQVEDASGFEDSPAREEHEEYYSDRYDAKYYDYAAHYVDQAERERAAQVLYGEEKPAPEEEEEGYYSRHSKDFVAAPTSMDNNYIESLGKLYDREEEKPAEPLTTEPAPAISPDPLTLGQVREMFYAQGYNLKPYTKTTNAGYYINKYFYSNRLLRDCALILYCVYLAELLICAFAGGISWGAFGLAAGLGILAPAFMFIVYSVDPDKRKRATYNFKSASINCIAFCICYIALVFILGFFLFGVRADAGETWIRPIVIPLVFMIDAPIAVFIYSKLYSSRRYHIN